MQKPKPKSKGAKISTSLKRHHKTKRVKKDIKKVAILLSIVFVISQIHATFKPVALANDTDRHHFLPRNVDKELTIIDKIIIESRKAGLDEEIMVEIARLESRFDPDATYNNGDSVDRGLFMINDYWHSEVSNACSFSVDCNIKEAVRIAKESGYGQWVTYNKFIR